MRTQISTDVRPPERSTDGVHEEHWHGATPDRFMAHVAVQEADETGRVVTWLEHVTDEEYATGEPLAPRTSREEGSNR